MDTLKLLIRGRGAVPDRLEPAAGVSQCNYELLRAFDGYMRSARLRWSLGAGTLLGAMRNRPPGLLQWEHDVDAYVPARDASALLRRLLPALTRHYPYSLHRAYVAPVNVVFWAIWSVAKALLPAKVTERFTLLSGDDWREKLAEEIGEPEVAERLRAHVAGGLPRPRVHVRLELALVVVAQVHAALPTGGDGRGGAYRPAAEADPLDRLERAGRHIAHARVVSTVVDSRRPGQASCKARHLLTVSNPVIN